METLLHNQFVSGGLVLMLTGALMGLLRQTPLKIYDWLKRRFSISLTIIDTDPLFEWTKLWLDTLPYSHRARNITCSLYRDPEEDFSTESRTMFAPAYGDHFFRHGSKFIWLSRSKNEQPAGPGSVVGADARKSETITLMIFGTKQQIARELVGEIMSAARVVQQKKVRGYTSAAGWWRRLTSFEPRKLETVDLPIADERRITQTIDSFLMSRTDYARRGIPYHFNLLFSGLPGTGKTSLAAALCGHFGLHLHLLNIGGPGINDNTLIDLMMSVPRRSLLLLEDVDAVVPERKRSVPDVDTKSSGSPVARDEETGVTLSGLLNCMDGITAPDGVVIVLTPNHPEGLDPALLRPGRVDMRVEFGPATREQIERMCQRLKPNVRLNGQVESMIMQKFTTAQVQAELLSSNSPI